MNFDEEAVGSPLNRRRKYDWRLVRSAILSALVGFPGAREAVVEALIALRVMEAG